MQTLMGQRKEGAKLRKIGGGREEWENSPLFTATDKDAIESEYVSPWNPGVLLCGTFHGQTLPKFKDVERKDGSVQRKQVKRGVGYFKSTDGTPFRIYTTGQLLGTLKNINEGSYLEITYNGKVNREIDGEKTDVHHFTIEQEAQNH